MINHRRRCWLSYRSTLSWPVFTRRITTLSSSMLIGRLHLRAPPEDAELHSQHLEELGHRESRRTSLSLPTPGAQTAVTRICPLQGNLSGLLHAGICRRRGTTLQMWPLREARVEQMQVWRSNPEEALSQARQPPRRQLLGRLATLRHAPAEGMQACGVWRARANSSRCLPLESALVDQVPGMDKVAAGPAHEHQARCGRLAAVLCTTPPLH
mmetsp:Transcript_31911/g.74671  ORF Transcript_31911/g.74671 Transcript_31911/m.74671 type:complete len:212 (-) Transcript_31911:117-752(-)